MADTFGGVPPPLPPGPAPAVGRGDGAPGGGEPTTPATVLRILGETGGLFRHEVRFLGQVATLEAWTRFEPGTVLDVLARRDAEGWTVRLPGTPRPRGTSAPRGPSSTVSGAQETGVRASLGPRSLGTPASADPTPVRPGLEGIAREIIDRVSGALRERGIEPSVSLLRGGARILTSVPTENTAPPGTHWAVATRIQSLLAAVPTDGGEWTDAARAARDALSWLSTALRTGPRPSGAVPQLPGTVLTAVDALVEALLGRDPTVAAARRAQSELGTSGTRPLPAPSPSILLDGASGPLPDGLSGSARRHGLEMTRSVEQRAIAEHSLFRALRPLLGDLVGEVESLAYRVAIDGDPPERTDPPTRDWVGAGETKHGYRLRWRSEGAVDRGPGHGSRRSFRLEVEPPALGAVVAEGHLDGLPGSYGVRLEIAAERRDASDQLAGELEWLIRSLVEAGLLADVAVVPWRRGRPDPESSSHDRLDRKA